MITAMFPSYAQDQQTVPITTSWFSHSISEDMDDQSSRRVVIVPFAVALAPTWPLFSDVLAGRIVRFLLVLMLMSLVIMSASMTVFVSPGL